MWDNLVEEYAKGSEIPSHRGIFFLVEFPIRISAKIFDEVLESYIEQFHGRNLRGHFKYLYDFCRSSDIHQAEIYSADVHSVCTRNNMKILLESY